MAVEYGNRFVGVSWRIDRRAQAAQALDALAGWRHAAREGAALYGEPTGHSWFDRDDALCMNTPGAVSARDSRLHDPRALLARLGRDGSAADALAAPFSGAWLKPGEETLHAATDAFGIGQLFYVEADAGAAVSNSATLLARLFGCALDHQALTGYALFGTFQDEDTPFAGVRKVPAGHSLELSDGRAVLRRRAAPPAEGPVSLEGLAKNLRETAIRLSDAAPEADLQLSGGLDSRLILAALPPDRRRRHRALTIGGPGSADVRIAREIAARQGLRHQVVDTATADGLDAESFADLMRRAVESFDCAANPIDKATLLLVDGKLDCDVWFNGQNGESLRGFYYPGQKVEETPSEALARSLIAWRLESNDLVDPRLFEPEAYRARKAAAEQRMVERLTGLGRTWSEALDNLYVYDRMQRWAGNGLDNLINRRSYLCPFFDPSFVQDAFALPAASKAGPSAAFRVLNLLDPDLAAMPLDSGLRPALAATSPLRARIAEAKVFAKKASAKLKRRISKTGRGTLGSSTIAELWSRHRLYERLPRQQMLATGLFAPAMLDKIGSGEWLPDRPTLGFVLMTAELCGGQA